MEFGTLLAGIPTSLLATVEDVTPLGITVLGALAGITIALKVLGKFGVRR